MDFEIDENIYLAENSKTYWDDVSRFEKLSKLESFADKVNWKIVCTRSDLKIDFLQRNLRRLSFTSLIKNENVPFSFIEHNSQYFKPVDYMFNQCVSLTASDIEKYKDKYWSQYFDVKNRLNYNNVFFWKTLLKNKNLYIPFYKKYLDNFPPSLLADCVNINSSFREAYPFRYYPRDYFLKDSISRMGKLKTDF